MTTKTCHIEGCRKPIKGRGLCSMHISRLQRHPERPLTVAGQRGGQVRDLAERILGSVQVTAEGCWLWTGYLNRTHYGTLSIGSRNGVLAHRASYELFVGPIPDGLCPEHVGHFKRSWQAVTAADLSPRPQP
jgi:hypothetical protein